MGNPEKGPGKLGHEGRGNEQPKPAPKPPPGLGATALKGAGVKK
jgi:hypothetical protein